MEGRASAAGIVSKRIPAFGIDVAKDRLDVTAVGDGRYAARGARITPRGMQRSGRRCGRATRAPSTAPPHRGWALRAPAGALADRLRDNPTVAGFYRRLCAAGKPRKVAIIASMRKLLTIVNAMARTRRPYADMTHAG